MPACRSCSPGAGDPRALRVRRPAVVGMSEAVVGRLQAVVGLLPAGAGLLPAVVVARRQGAAVVVAMRSAVVAAVMQVAVVVGAVTVQAAVGVTQAVGAAPRPVAVVVVATRAARVGRGSGWRRSSARPRHSGTLPCLRRGSSSRLVANIRSPATSFWRVSAGSITSSM
jgi:hypothetical protein